jgi:hypothetical protein
MSLAVKVWRAVGRSYDSAVKRSDSIKPCRVRGSSGQGRARLGSGAVMSCGCSNIPTADVIYSFVRQRAEKTQCLGEMSVLASVELARG